MPPAENAIAQRQDVGMAAEVVGQLYDAVGIRRAHGRQMIAIHGNVSAAKTVYGLLRIADDAQTLACRSRELRYHIDLQLIGILELVDHDQLETVGIACGDFGMIPQCARRKRQQIGIVEHAGLALFPRENLRDQRSDLDHRLKMRSCDARARLGCNALIAHQQLGLHLAIGRTLAKIRARHRKGVHQLNGLDIRNLAPASERSFDRSDCGFRRCEKLVARRTGFHRTRQLIDLACRINKLHQQFFRARRFGRKLYSRHAVGTCLGDGHELANHPFDRHDERSALAARRKLGEQRVDAILINAVKAVDHVVASADDLLQRAFQQRFGPTFVDDAEFRIYSQLKRMRAQDSRAHAMNSGDPGVVDLERLIGHSRRTQSALHAGLYLAGSFGCERDGQHLVDIVKVSAFERMHDAFGQCERFP